MNGRLLIALLVVAVPGQALADAKRILPRAPAYDSKRRVFVEKLVDYRELQRRLQVPGEFWSSTSGSVIKRTPRDVNAISERKRLAVSRIAELDPQSLLTSLPELRDVLMRPTRQVTNKAEGLEFGVFDQTEVAYDARRLEELTRGRLAKKLAAVLAGETPSPATLQAVANKLAEQHPALRSPFEVEMLIADTRKLVPELGRWDFRTHTDGRTFRGDRVLPPSTQAVVARVGYRAFRDANVLFANHLYKDSLVMADALTALGLQPKNASFVTTPYPFSPRVRKAMQLRGIQVESAPNSVEKTKIQLAGAIDDLLLRSNDNGGPIVVFDDGGLATEIIARDHAADLHRFRIIEITKVGERIGKRVLPPTFGVDPRDHKTLDYAQAAAMRAKYIEVNSYNDAAAKNAAARWDNMSNAARFVAPKNPPKQVPAHLHGFAYYTYSNTQYKRDVMTPLYSEQVNASLFGALERGDGKRAITPINNRVTIVGGGAMGLSAARELRSKDYEVTFVETDAGRVELLVAEGFAVEPIRKALPGRGIVLEMSGIENIIGIHEMGLLENGAILAHGSSKDIPFDTDALHAFAERTAWPDHNGQHSASYTFKVAGLEKTIHMPGDGFTISHGGKSQNVPLDKFMPELDRLLNLSVYALENKAVSYYPMYTAPESAMDPTGARKTAP